jgi:two-component system, NtrC family, sensor kinase
VTEAFDQQTATSEILRVISSSPTDVQPVFDAIVQSASRLCEAEFSAVVRFEDGLLHLVGTSNVSSAEIEAYHSLFPRPPSRDFIMGRAFLDGRPVHVEDVLLDPDYDPRRLEVLQRAATFRTYLGIPIVRSGIPIGAIGCGRYEMRPFTDAQVELVKTFADQAGIAIENVRLFNETKEALDQQTATSDILRAISRSPTDVQPVFDAIAERAMHLCGASTGGVTRFDGELVHIAALANVDPQAAAAIRSAFPMPPSNRSAAGRAVLTRSIVHIPDVGADAEYGIATQVGAAFRSVVAVPMLQKGKAIGSVAVGRPSPGPFSERQVSLLQAFADQAVIAIENVRLFNALKEKNSALTQALEQQTATAEILGIISSSPTRLQPVFDTIVRNAVQLCGAAFGGLHRLHASRITLDAQYGIDADEVAILQRDVFPLPLSRGSATGRAILDWTPIHIRDIREDPDYRTRVKTMETYRTILAVPLIREGIPVGALALWRPEVRPFNETEIGLVQTFANQAVIAMENVRLFKELEAKNRDLTEALEQQTATGEILRVISSSPTDVHPVFEAIAANAARVCEAGNANVYRFDGTLIHVEASYGYTAEELAAVQGTFPMPPGCSNATSRAVSTGVIVHVPDMTADPEYASPAFIDAGFRTSLSVPMLRESKPIGTISGAPRREAVLGSADRAAPNFCRPGGDRH